MNEIVEIFLEEFGPPVPGGEDASGAIEWGAGVFPESLQLIWKDFGFCGFKRGLLWFVDPAAFEEKFSRWIEGFEEFSSGRLFVFARSSFGDMYAYQPSEDRVVKVLCANNMIITSRRKRVVGSTGAAIDTFLSNSYVEDFEFFDGNGEPMHFRALKRLGELSSSEVYGFEPMLSIGGAGTLEQVRRFRIDGHLDLLYEFSSVELRAI